MKTLWRLRICFWLMFYGYTRWGQPVYTWRWSGDECWISYYDDGESPRGAILEDASYG